MKPNSSKVSKFSSVLKLKKHIVDKIKLEIAGLISKRDKLASEVQELEAYIQKDYSEQEQRAKGIAAQGIQFYPSSIWSNMSKKKELKIFIKNLDEKIVKKKKDLAIARANVKLFEKLDMEQRTNFKKHKDKKEQAQLEELNQFKKYYG